MLQFLDRIPNRKFRMHNFLSPQKENSEVLRDILLYESRHTQQGMH